MNEDQDQEDDKISMAFPVEPTEISSQVIPKIINWLAEEYGMEAVYYKTEEDDEAFYVIEVLRPDNWLLDQEQVFVGNVGAYCLLETAKYTEEDSDETPI